MTIPQADSTDLRSVSDRQEVVTLAEVGVVDQSSTAEVNKSITNPLTQDRHQQQQQQQRQHQEKSQKLGREEETTGFRLSQKRLATSDTAASIESASVEASLIVEYDKKGGNGISVEEENKIKSEERKKLEDAKREQNEETGNIGIIGNQNALKCEGLVLSSLENHDNFFEGDNKTINIDNDVTFCELSNNSEKCQNDEGIVSALPLLKIPSYSSISAPSVSYNHRTRKSSINFPVSHRETAAATSTIAVSSSSSSYQSSSSSSSLSNTKKTRRKSLPQRLGLRYQKIPQDDIVSPSDIDTNDTNVEIGILNLQYIPSPVSAPFSSSPQDRSSHQLSFHSAEVHASFHPSQTSTSIVNSPSVEQQNPSTSYNSSTTSQTTNKSRTLNRDVTFKTLDLPTSKTGSLSNPSSSSKKPISASSTSTSSSSKNRNKSGRGGNSSKTSLPLRRTLSLSLKSLNDLSVVHPAGRGGSNRKKHKSQSRSVSTEDLANCRVHRGGGGRFAGDPHPSPGSPSHCCLVSVSRVPMAAATSHLTLDSEYQTVRLAVLGAPGVGKSSIVKQFVMQQFLEEYVPTEQRQVFCPAVIINDHLYEVRIIDCPYIPYFPVNSLYEWTDFRGYGLRNATAYVLVYDITSEESFEYIKSLRLQILESRNLHDVPIFVVGNKHDLAEERGVPRREVANLVKKQWKCGYIECSAKYNWHIMLLFKELMKTVDYIDYGHKPTSLRVQDALRRNRCLIL